MDSSLEKKIQILIDDNAGDIHRLEDMLERNKTGKKLYNSDLLYLEKISPDEKPVVFTDDTFVFKKETQKDILTKKMVSLKIKIGIPITIMGVALGALFVVSYVDISPLCDLIPCTLFHLN